MKVLYSARARPDLAPTLSYLAQYPTQYAESCDKRLRTLLSYVHNSLAHRMCAWGEPQRTDYCLQLEVYSDVDSAGCSATQRSTVGAIVFLPGAGFSAPLSFLSNRQGRGSRSTPESEIVAVDAAIRLLTPPPPLVDSRADVWGQDSQHMRL